jgi:hypothetical protein
MILGMSVATFTLVHVIVSLAGILSGIVLVLRMLVRPGLDGWNAVFLVTTIATSATGFLFPSSVFGPAHVFGVISLVVLAVALVALCAGHLAGAWRWIYAASAVLALYLNVFVLVVQLFDKIEVLHKLAPTGVEAPFTVAQAAVLLLFVMLGALAVRRFHPTLAVAAGR